jgi:hypothetical protein
MGEEYSPLAKASTRAAIDARIGSGGPVGFPSFTSAADRTVAWKIPKGRINMPNATCFAHERADKNLKRKPAPAPEGQVVENVWLRGEILR